MGLIKITIELNPPNFWPTSCCLERGSGAHYLTVQLGQNWADIQQLAEEFELSIFLFAALLWQPSITSP